MAVIAQPTASTSTRFTKSGTPPSSTIASPADIGIQVDDLTAADDLTVTDDFVVGATGSTGATAIVISQNANALSVGRQGATAPAFQVDSATASSATGVKVTAAAAASGVNLAAISSGTNENLTINAKGSGTIGIGSVSTGAVTITPALNVTGLLTAAEAGGNAKAKGFTVTDGGTVTQATTISTGVELNTTTGQITTVTGPSIAAGAEAAFTVTNSVVAATSTIIVNVATQFSDGEVVAYVKSIGAGSFVIGLTNVSAAAVSAGAAVINFAVFGGSAT